MNPNKRLLIDITPTKHICPDHEDELVIIDIPEELEPELNTTCWIHRVPIKLRQVNEAAYTPQLVSIGPLHHGKPKFKSMEGHKTKYQDQFWERDFCKHIVKKKVDVVKRFMKDGDRIERIRRCYAGTFELANKDQVDDLAKVILNDTCFIFELFLRNYESKIMAEAGVATKDYILRTPWLRCGIELDLILLENQLPFFVFTELFDFIMDTQPVKITPLNHLSERRNESQRHFYLSECRNESERHVFLLKLVIEFFYTAYCNGQALNAEEQQELLKRQPNIHYTKQKLLDKQQRVDQKKKMWGVMQLFTKKEEVGITTMMAAGRHVASSQLAISQVASAQRVTKIVSGRGGPSSELDHVEPVKNLMISDTVDGEEMKRLVTIKHFTDLVRQFMRPKKYPSKSSTIVGCLYSAKKLDRAGVKFKPGKKRYLADIISNYDNDNRAKCKPWNSLKVEVPKFKVEDSTEFVMRNVMALEQCLYPKEAHICNYVSLLDQLIDTAEDVELLIEKKILENLLGSNEAVAQLVNKLRDHIVEAEFCYSDLCGHLNGHCDSWWSVSKETFKRVYLKDLWTGSSTVVGFFVTCFTIVSLISTFKDLISG